ncbi:MAG TPA: tetratricopeptide repeat protein [Arenicellales bacterium]|nr:tetratricopeptide repeat protein [Arenicellales bacterium]
MKPNLPRLVPLMLATGILAAGCGPAVVDRAPDVETGPEPEATTTRSEPINTPAVLELSSQARRALADKRHDEAAQLLERAIRIEPQNGAIWHELARVRFQQGDYEQARQLAGRSNALLAGDSTLKARNDELIRKAREAESY